MGLLTIELLRRPRLLSCMVAATVTATTATLCQAQLPPPRSPEIVATTLQRQRLEAVERVMLHLNAGERDTAMIELVYAPDALFIDPVFPEGLRGHQALLDYHTSLNAMIEAFTVDVKEVLTHGDSVLVFWEAESTLSVKLGLGEALRAAGLPDLGGRFDLRLMRLGPMRYDGMTRFEFARHSPLISEHKDFYDGMAQYESIPVLRLVLGALRHQIRRSLSSRS
jgi:hypothetical protein